MSDEKVTAPEEVGEAPMGRRYALVVVLEAITLLALWVFQRHFGG